MRTGTVSSCNSVHCVGFGSLLASFPAESRSLPPPKSCNFRPQPTSCGLLATAHGQAMAHHTIQTPITKLLGIKHPIILAGMNQASGPELAAAVSNAGGCACACL